MPRLPRASQTKIEVGTRLRAAREALGLQSKEAAKVSGVADNTWSMYEIGERLADVLAMARFSKQFGVTLDWIYMGNAGALPDHIRKQVVFRVHTNPGKSS